MDKIIFATINSFVGLPPVKQLLGHFKKKARIYCVQCELDDHENFLKAKEVNHHTIHRFTSSKEFNSQSFKQKLSKYFKMICLLVKMKFKYRSKEQAIFTTDIFTLALNLLLKNKGHQLIYLQYELIDVNQLNTLDQFIFKMVQALSARIDIIVTPELNRTEFLQQLLPKANAKTFLTLPNTNNNSTDEAVVKNLGDKGPKIITHIGAVGLNHHIESFLKAVSELDQAHYEVRFVGSLTQEVLELITKYECSCVKVIGQIKHSELKKYYQETDLGIILYKDVSLNHRFCAPNKLYEYWSYGIPVVGDRLPGLQSIFTEDYLGRLINMADSNQIFEAIENITQNDSAKRRILQHFHKHFKLDNYLDQLDRMLVMD
jgi:glycosyltransferase involved in cell wall biosynthesis